MTASIYVRDLPATDDYRDQWCQEVDTDANRKRLAGEMADAAMGMLTWISFEGKPLDDVIGDWLGTLDGETVVGWMVDHGIAPSYEAWLADQEAER